MPQAAKNQTEIGLALQGGGALGAYECGAVTALLELMDQAEALGRSIVLKGVAGVSIGAINAACVVGRPHAADAVVLAAGSAPRLGSVRAARFLHAAPRPVGDVQLDVLLRHP